MSHSYIQFGSAPCFEERLDQQFSICEDILPPEEVCVWEGDAPVGDDYYLALEEQAKRDDARLNPSRLALATCPGPGAPIEKYDIYVEGLPVTVPVWLAEELHVSYDKVGGYLNGLFSYMETVGLGKMFEQFIMGRDHRHYGGKIVLTSSDDRGYDEAIRACSSSTGGGGSTALFNVSTNTIFVRYDLKAFAVADSYGNDISSLGLTQMITHEFLHSREGQLSANLGPLREHYEALLHEAFPKKEDYDRYLYLVDRCYGLRQTAAELDEYWSVFVPIIDKHFMYYHAASDFSEYFAVSGAAYLTLSPRVRDNRARLKKLDAVGYQMFEGIFGK